MKTYRKPKPKDGFEDGRDRATIGVWMRLTREEVDAAEKLAENEELSLSHFLRKLGEHALKNRIAGQNST